MATAQEIYSGSVKDLPASERLRLAAMILDELSETTAAALDYSDEWSDQDVRDLGSYSLRIAEQGGALASLEGVAET
jgi:hypothetical protein